MQAFEKEEKMLLKEDAGCGTGGDERFKMYRGMKPQGGFPEIQLMAKLEQRED